MSGSAWWNALRIRPEITNASGQIEDVQMSLGAAVFPPPGVPAPEYADPGHYGQITHPTGRLTALLADIAIRLAGGPDGYTKAGALTRLNQGMGGGKSHALIGAWHLAAHARDFLATDIGAAVTAAAADKLGRPLPADLGRPVVAVLDLDNGTPGIGSPALDGPFAKTLYEKFLWRLFAGDAAAFTEYREHWQDKAKIKEALAAQGRPVLIVVDEIMDYLGNGLTGAGDEQLTAQDMAFLRALLDSVNDVPYCAMLVAMIDPEKDRISLAADGRQRQQDLHSLLERNGRTATVNEDTDFTAILRRRLFTAPPTAAASAAAAGLFEQHRMDQGWGRVYAQLGADWVAEWDAAVARSYPFHPQLMHLAEQEWAKQSGYQNVRSTIRVFAATVYALQQRALAGGWAPHLIGPGDLPLWNNEVREALLGSGLISDISLEANYRSIIAGDITSLAGSDDPSGQASGLDRTETTKAYWGQANPHAHERAATMIVVASLIPRGAARRGASEPEIKIASALPDITYAAADADGVIARLTDINSEASMASVEPIEGKGGQPRRYYLNPETGAKVVYRQHRQAITSLDRDTLIASTAQDLATAGPFGKVLFVDADRTLTEDERRERATATLLDAGIDQPRSNRLVVLDPAGYSLRNGMGQATLAAVRAASGIGAGAAVVTWASSAVFAVVNTQRRRAAREAAADYLAWQRTHDSPELRGNDAARTTARTEMQQAKQSLDKNLRRAYQHILYVSQISHDSPRTVEELTLENEAETALNGSTVWKELAARSKAFQTGQFTALALQTNLAAADYGKPLSELRDAFFQAPRLPLLPGGDNDLRSAIYSAMQSKELRLVDAAGNDVAAGAPSEINLNSQGLRLARPTAEPDPGPGAGPVPGPGSGPAPAPAPVTGRVPVPQEKTQFKFTLNHEVTDDTREQMGELMMALYSAVVYGEATFVLGTLNVVLEGGSAGAVRAAAAALGLQVQEKPAAG